MLLPLRIEDVLPEAALEYYLGTPHWLDAITKPFEAHLEKLADACASLLAVTGELPRDADNSSAGSDHATTAGTLLAEQPSADHRNPLILWWRRQRRRVQVGLIVASIVILAAAGVTFQLLRPHSPTSSTAQPPTKTSPIPPVAESALAGLLLSPADINTAMGATRMQATVNSALAQDGSTISDPKCLPMAGTGESAIYTGTGYTAYVGQQLEDSTEITPGAHEVVQFVFSFVSTDRAADFFTAASQSWQTCANRSYTHTTSGVVWAVGSVVNLNGTLAGTRIQDAGGGWGCQRALTVSNNVVIDVAACSYPPGDQAVTIAHQIAAKVAKH